MKTNQLVTGRIVYTSKIARDQKTIEEITNFLLNCYNTNSSFNLQSFLSNYMNKNLVREVIREVNFRKILVRINSTEYKYFKNNFDKCSAPNIIRIADIIEVASQKLSHKRVIATLKKISNKELLIELKSRGLWKI